MPLYVYFSIVRYPMPKAIQRMPARLLSINKYFVWSRSYTEVEHTPGNILYNICLCFFVFDSPIVNKTGPDLPQTYIYYLLVGVYRIHNVLGQMPPAPTPLPLHIFLYCFVLCLFFANVFIQSYPPQPSPMHIVYVYIFSRRQTNKKDKHQICTKENTRKKNPGPQQ